MSGVQADQRVAEVGLDQRFLRLACEVGGPDEMPAEARDCPALPGEARRSGGRSTLYPQDSHG